MIFLFLPLSVLGVLHHACESPIISVKQKYHIVFILGPKDADEHNCKKANTIIKIKICISPAIFMLLRYHVSNQWNTQSQYDSHQYTFIPIHKYSWHLWKKFIETLMSHSSLLNVFQFKISKLVGYRLLKLICIDQRRTSEDIWFVYIYEWNVCIFSHKIYALN